MRDELKKRLIEVRTHLDAIEAVGGLYLDTAEMSAHVTQLIQMHGELTEMYLAEREQVDGREFISVAESLELNALAETLEAAQAAAIWLTAELRALSPDDVTTPEIVAFEHAMQDIHDSINGMEQHLTERGV